MLSWGRTDNELLLLVSVSVVSILLQLDQTAIHDDRDPQLSQSLMMLQTSHGCLTLTANTDWGAQLPSIWIMNSLIEQQCGPVVIENINSRC